MKELSPEGRAILAEVISLLEKTGTDTAFLLMKVCGRAGNHRYYREVRDVILEAYPAKNLFAFHDSAQSGRGLNNAAVIRKLKELL